MPKRENNGRRKAVAPDLMPMSLTASTRKRIKRGDTKQRTEDNTPPTFKYKSLPQLRGLIRVTEVLPEKSNGLIRCRMRRMLITEESHPYTCLSYTWGEATAELCSISIQDADSSNTGIFAVRQNLHDFLQVSTTRLYIFEVTPLQCVTIQHLIEAIHRTEETTQHMF